jgi:membrane protein
VEACLARIYRGNSILVGKTILAFISARQIRISLQVAGSVILILLWVSYSSMILFFGAEFTAAYKFYNGVTPTAIAKGIIQQER